MFRSMLDMFFTLAPLARLASLCRLGIKSHARFIICKIYRISFVDILAVVSKLRFNDNIRLTMEDVH